MKKRAVALATAVIFILLGVFLYNGMGNLKGLFSRGTDESGDSIRPPDQLLNTKDEGIGPNKYINTLVTKVVDGDTININYNNKTYKVRLLDVDTPESVKQGVSVQPYGKEATQFTKQKVLNKKVKLVFEKATKDRYGRLLAHVILSDGGHLNSMLVNKGYARVEIVSPNKSFSDYFYELQTEAISREKGFWALPEKKQPFVKNNKGKYVPRYLKQKAS